MAFVADGQCRDMEVTRIHTGLLWRAGGERWNNFKLLLLILAQVWIFRPLNCTLEVGSLWPISTLSLRELFNKMPVKRGKHVGSYREIYKSLIIKMFFSASKVISLPFIKNICLSYYKYYNWWKKMLLKLNDVFKTDFPHNMFNFDDLHVNGPLAVIKCESQKSTWIQKHTNRTFHLPHKQNGLYSW